jgi:hypothetical protein
VAITKILAIKVGMSIEVLLMAVTKIWAIKMDLPVCWSTSHPLFLVLALSNFNIREVRKLLVMIETKKYKIWPKPKVLVIKKLS